MAIPISQAQWVMGQRREFGRLQRGNGGVRRGGRGGGGRGRGNGDRRNMNNGGRGFARGGGGGNGYWHGGAVVKSKHKALDCLYSLDPTPIDSYYQCYTEYDEDDHGNAIIILNLRENICENLSGIA